MNLYQTLYDSIMTVIAAAVELPPNDPALARIALETPRESGHGEVALNAAMVLAKPLGQPPRALADKWLPLLQKMPEIAAAEVAGPGFINLTLKPTFWQQVVPAALSAGKTFGHQSYGQGQKVNVEYVSANPTGPMLASHARGAVLGDAIAELLKAVGYDVTKEYYINDAGAQVDVLARSVHLRYRQLLGDDIGEFPAKAYPGEYLIPVAQYIKDSDSDRWLGKEESEWLEYFRSTTIGQMLALIKQDLASLNIHHDVFTSEAELVRIGRVQEAFDELQARGLIYNGVLEPPKGKAPDDWEPRPQDLFKATEFGDDVDRPLRKSDGSWTYFASDIAYHYDKFRRGFALMINIFGADHAGYVKRIEAATRAVTGGAGKAEVEVCQLVRLLQDGQPVRLSKRAGNLIFLSDVVEAVGKDVVRLFLLTRDHNQSLDFDFKKVTEQSKDNPVFYIQYAHARICSVLRHATEHFSETELRFSTDLTPLPTGEVAARSAAGEGSCRHESPSPSSTKFALGSLSACYPLPIPGDLAVAGGEGLNLALLTDPEEIALIRLLAAWPKTLRGAALAREPHRIAYYLYDLAAQFHQLWNHGREQAELRFIIPEHRELTYARLALLKATQSTLQSALALIGVEPITQM